MPERARRSAAALVAAALVLLTPAATAAVGHRAPVTTVATRSGTATHVSTATTTPAPTTVTTTTTTHPAAVGAAATAPAVKKKPVPAKPARKRPPKPVVPLTGWLGNASPFPARAVVLSAPTLGGLPLSAVHVTENGAPVGPFTLTPVAAAGVGDFGTMFVVDQSRSMQGAGLSAAISGVQAFATRRTPNQELGLITFDSVPSRQLALTSDQSKIDGALGVTPWVGSGADVSAATTMALAQVAQAKVALGAIVVISDGVGISAGGGSTPQSVRAAAAATHTQLITVGLKDGAATPASLQALANAAPGGFVAATPASLPSVLVSIAHDITSGYVLRYRSRVAAGASVAMTVRADGIPGGVDIGYQAPQPVKAQPPSVPAPAPAVPQHRSGPDFSQSTLLTALPSFAHPPPPPPAAAATSKSFWTSPAGIAAVSGICGLLIVIALALVLHRPSTRAVRTRVGSFVPALAVGLDGSVLPGAASRRGLLEAVQQGKWWPPFVEAVGIARSPHTPIYLVKRAAVFAMIVAVGLTVVSGSVLVGLIALIGWPFVLRMLVNRAAEKQRAKFRDTLPAYLQDLASAMRVGRSFAGALAIVADSADEPTRSELERAVTDEALGRPIEASLEAVSIRMASSDIDQVALIAALNRRSGSNVAEALDRVAEGARDRADLRREMKALTGQAKMSSSILTGLPGVLLLGLSVVSPAYSHPLFHTTIGIVSLTVGFVLVVIGWKVMQKITKLEA